MDNQARTQLSIFDPCGFSLEAERKVHRGLKGKSGDTTVAACLSGARVNDAGVAARVSYNDLVLAMSIIERFGDWVTAQQQQQQQQGSKRGESAAGPLPRGRRDWRDKATERRIRRERHVALARLKLIEDDPTLCLETLMHFGGRYEAAALALCEHAHVSKTAWSASKAPRFATTLHMPGSLTSVKGPQLLKMWFQQHVLHKRCVCVRVCVCACTCTCTCDCACVPVPVPVFLAVLHLVSDFGLFHHPRCFASLLIQRFQRAESKLSSLLARRSETEASLQQAQEQGLVFGGSAIGPCYLAPSRCTLHFPPYTATHSTHTHTQTHTHTYTHTHLPPPFLLFFCLLLGDHELAATLQQSLRHCNADIDLVSAQFAMVSAEVSAVLADTGLESFEARKPHPTDELVK